MILKKMKIIFSRKRFPPLPIVKVIIFLGLDYSICCIFILILILVNFNKCFTFYWRIFLGVLTILLLSTGELKVKVDGNSTPDQKANTPRSKHSATEQRRRSKINDRQVLKRIVGISLLFSNYWKVEISLYKIIDYILKYIAIFLLQISDVEKYHSK